MLKFVQEVPGLAAYVGGYFSLALKFHMHHVPGHAIQS